MYLTTNQNVLANQLNMLGFGFLPNENLPRTSQNSLYQDWYSTNELLANQQGSSAHVNDTFPVGFVRSNAQQQGFNPDYISQLTLGFFQQQPSQTPLQNPLGKNIDDLLGVQGSNKGGGNCKYHSVLGWICQNPDGTWKDSEGNDILISDGEGVLSADMTSPNAAFDGSMFDIGSKWWAVLLAVVIIIIGIALIK